MYRFINGLRPALRALVYTTMPNTLREAVEAADYFETMTEHEHGGYQTKTSSSS
jgi:hypothetical protein